MLKIEPKLQKYFKGHEYPAKIIMILIYMKGRILLSSRKIEEIGRLRGINIDHSTLQRWVVKFMPILEGKVQKKKKASKWYLEDG